MTRIGRPVSLPRIFAGLEERWARTLTYGCTEKAVLTRELAPNEFFAHFEQSILNLNAYRRGQEDRVHHMQQLRAWPPDCLVVL